MLVLIVDIRHRVLVLSGEEGGRLERTPEDILALSLSVIGQIVGHVLKLVFCFSKQKQIVFQCYNDLLSVAILLLSVCLGAVCQDDLTIFSLQNCHVTMVHRVGWYYYNYCGLASLLCYYLVFIINTFLLVIIELCISVYTRYEGFGAIWMPLFEIYLQSFVLSQQLVLILNWLPWFYGTVLCTLACFYSSAYNVWRLGVKNCVLVFDLISEVVLGILAF